MLQRSRLPTVTTVVERSFEVEATVEEVWELLSDPLLRAQAISVVDRFEVDGKVTVWRLKLPIRTLPGTIPVRTRDVERDPPRYVRFKGTSWVMDVEGEHELTPTEFGCSVRNRFVVDGKFPGVETFFSASIDDEINHLFEFVSDQVSSAK